MPDPRFPGKHPTPPSRGGGGPTTPRPPGPPGPPRPPGPPPAPPRPPQAQPGAEPGQPSAPGSPEPKECPKCQGRMVTHSILNNCCAITLLGKDEQGQFVFNPAAGVPVALFCCEGCGFIEFYSAVTLGLI